MTRDSAMRLEDRLACGRRRRPSRRRRRRRAGRARRSPPSCITVAWTKSGTSVSSPVSSRPYPLCGRSPARELRRVRAASCALDLAHRPSSARRAPICVALVVVRLEVLLPGLRVPELGVLAAAGPEHVLLEAARDRAASAGRGCARSRRRRTRPRPRRRCASASAPRDRTAGASRAAPRRRPTPARCTRRGTGRARS